MPRERLIVVTRMHWHCAERRSGLHRRAFTLPSTYISGSILGSRDVFSKTVASTRSVIFRLFKTRIRCIAGKLVPAALRRATSKDKELIMRPSASLLLLLTPLAAATPAPSRRSRMERRFLEAPR